MKSRGACSGRHLEGYSGYLVPSRCILTIPEVQHISESIIPEARLGWFLPFGNAKTADEWMSVQGVFCRHNY
jgi:hypothetical protein